MGHRWAALPMHSRHCWALCETQGLSGKLSRETEGSRNGSGNQDLQSAWKAELTSRWSALSCCACSAARPSPCHAAWSRLGWARMAPSPSLSGSCPSSWSRVAEVAAAACHW